MIGENNSFFARARQMNDYSSGFQIVSWKKNLKLSEQ